MGAESPKPNPTEWQGEGFSEESLPAIRRGHVTERGVEADARNKSRSLGEKIMGKGKVSEIDIAHEEALEVNEKFDQYKDMETIEELDQETARLEQMKAEISAERVELQNRIEELRGSEVKLDEALRGIPKKVDEIKKAGGDIRSVRPGVQESTGRVESLQSLEEDLKGQKEAEQQEFRDVREQLSALSDKLMELQTTISDMKSERHATQMRQDLREQLK